jgi:murein DD-endopeptidase MepM/ murein hydrolase activator NlpD
MARRVILGLALALALVAVSPAAGDDINDKKRAVDAKLERLRDKIADARAREGALTTEISSYTAKIRGLQDDVDSAQARLDTLEQVLALQQRKLDRLNELFDLQTRRLVFLQKQYKVSVAHLNRRLVDLYVTEQPDTVSYVLAASNFSDLLDQLEFMQDIGRHDQKIAIEVNKAKVEMAETRYKTRKIRAGVAETTNAIRARTNEQLRIRNRLTWSQRELATTRRNKESALASVQESREEFVREADGLAQASAELAAKLRATQTGSISTGAPSSAGFIWPVNGPVTSGFGFRWGRIHEGIDIGVGNGTSVVAAASGTVVVAGWSGGYGNLVVIDHHNGLATAYGHNTSVTVGVGQDVSQGQLIAYSGNTGHSTGPHVHFEVRVSGSPVDPLGYL